MNTPCRGSTAKGGAAMLAALALGGCSLLEPKVVYEPYEVKVAVEVPCAAALPAEPAWATKALKKDNTGDDKAKALLAERKQREGYEEKLKAAVDGCR